MKEYHNLFNLSEILLLADIFENYFSAPGLACDATLKITKIQLELLSNPDMLLGIESCIKEGIATISHRHAKANNEYIGAEFDPVKESKFISYSDANNLYGWAMSKQHPTSGFEWMADDELDDWKHLSCILEVDLEKPEHLHDLHNDYPLEPECVKSVNVEKLIPNLNNKTTYHIATLKRTMNIWELSSIPLRNPNSSRI